MLTHAIGEYELSDRVNSQAADLIHHMLDPNFEERYSIEQIKSHEYVYLATPYTMLIFTFQILEHGNS